jgi:hypothetical protein
MKIVSRNVGIVVATAALFCASAGPGIAADMSPLARTSPSPDMPRKALPPPPRGKRLVVLVGQKKAVAIAVHSVSGRRRWSKLGEWLVKPKG